MSLQEHKSAPSPYKPSFPESESKLSEDAYYWTARRLSGEMTDTEEALFQAWIKESAENQEEIAELETLLNCVRLAVTSSRVT